MASIRKPNEERWTHRMMKRKRKREPVEHFLVETAYDSHKLAERLNHGWEAGWTRVSVMPRGGIDGYTIVWFTQGAFGRRSK